MGVRRRGLGRVPRPAMRSPGRPSVAGREDRQRFGKRSRAVRRVRAAARAGVSSAVGARWFREGGGMATISLAPLSGRYLSSPSGRRSRCCGCSSTGCERSNSGSEGTRRRSRVSFGGCESTARRDLAVDALADMHGVGGSAPWGMKSIVRIAPQVGLDDHGFVAVRAGAAAHVRRIARFVNGEGSAFSWKSNRRRSVPARDAGLWSTRRSRPGESSSRERER